MTTNKNNTKLFISRLIYAVLTDQIPVRFALLKFPTNTNDRSIMAVYHALIHYEADEDIRKKDIEYREEQDEYLEFLAETMEKGENLPLNIIEKYNEYYTDIPLPDSNGVRSVIKSLCKFLNV